MLAMQGVIPSRFLLDVSWFCGHLHKCGAVVKWIMSGTCRYFVFFFFLVAFVVPKLLVSVVNVLLLCYLYEVGELLVKLSRCPGGAVASTSGLLWRIVS